MKIGARVLKTGIAVTIAMFLSESFKLEPAAFAAVTAVVNMQPSIHLTMKTTKDQILIHVYGVMLGVILGYLFGGTPVTIGLTTIIIIALYNKLKLQNGIIMGVVAASFILTSPPQTFLIHAVTRSAVIFVGLAVAMIINVWLWPPRYNKVFLERLRTSNEEATKYFCKALLDFVYLDEENGPHYLETKKKLHDLNHETRELAKHLIHDTDNDTNNSAEDFQFSEAAEGLMNYNEALERKANRIYELIPARIDRRIKYGAPPISEEFKSILSILENGCPTVLRVNDKLRSVICDGKPIGQEEFSETYWESLSTAMEGWQNKLTSSYYLQALLEVAVVANELRWATIEGKKLLENVPKTAKHTKNPA